MSSDTVANFWTNGSSELYAETQVPVSSSDNTNVTVANQTANAPLDLTRAVPVGMVLGAFILFAIVGNILVILSVVCNRHLRIPTNYFIINLAIADLLLSTTVLPVSATLEILDHWVFGRIFCDIWAAVDVLCCTASIMSLCVISIDRYIGVRYPLHYPCIVIFWLGYLNSCLNPIIYPSNSQEFKQAFINILRCRCHRKKQKGWSAYYNYRSSNLGSASNSYTNGSLQTLSPVKASPHWAFGRGGSHPEPGLNRSAPSQGLPGSSFTRQTRALLPGDVGQSADRSNTAHLLSPLARESTRANGQTGNGEAEPVVIRATPVTTM
ncbi:hypothetical protein DPEC_G00227550 [Dallia pectoralis]|uniref:Uncharacterized protein n=1 Tax=Dallia pectoralis TaxID=75939 RepID=A0ACC2G0Z7_DALPE|nr:hypothetical protein DPEC_G00227550 [Dallia pectoralis]